MPNATARADALRKSLLLTLTVRGTTGLQTAFPPICVYKRKSPQRAAPGRVALARGLLRLVKVNNAWGALAMLWVSSL